MQPAAVQASLSLGLHALAADLKLQHSLGRSNVDIWGPVLGRWVWSRNDRWLCGCVTGLRLPVLLLLMF